MKLSIGGRCFPSAALPRKGLSENICIPYSYVLNLPDVMLSILSISLFENKESYMKSIGIRFKELRMTNMSNIDNNASGLWKSVAIKCLRYRKYKRAKNTETIAVRQRNVNKQAHNSNIAMLQIQIEVLLLVSFKMNAQRIIAVPNRTPLEFFTEKAYCSLIINPPRLVKTEYIPKNKADKI